MDNLTHTLTGLALARCGLERATPGATAALALASNVPDVDVVSWLAGTASYLDHHRDLSHSVLGAPLLALATAALLRLAVRRARFLPLLGCSALGVALHVFMDLWTSYGTRVLSPFDHGWYAWDLVFIVDPYVLLLLLSACLLPRAAPSGARPAGSSPRLAAVCLGLVLAYVGLRGVLHARAADEARARVPAERVQAAAALPTPLDPFTWRVLVDGGDAYWTGPLHLLGASPPLRRRPKRPETAAVVRARESSAVAAIFLDFSRFPWLEVAETPEGTEVTWSDLRFEHAGARRFTTRVVVAPDGTIHSEAFHF